jgi:hypothetical protein
MDRSRTNGVEPLKSKSFEEGRGKGMSLLKKLMNIKFEKNTL